TSVYVAGSSHTQRAAAIADHELGYRAEHPLAHRLHAGRGGQYQRDNPGPHDLGQLSFGSRHGEQLVRGFHQLARQGAALGLISIQERSGGAAVQHRRELPRKVDGIADSRVHALATRGTVDVCRIAKEEGATLAKTVGYTVMNAVGRKPVELADLHLQVLD